MNRRLSPLAPALALAWPLIAAACQNAAPGSAVPWTVPMAIHGADRRAGGVSIRVGLDPRSTLALVSDVDHLEFDLAETGVAAVQSQTLSKSQFGSLPTITFGGLPAGTADITLLADDALGANLGSASTSVAVVVGQVSTVHLDLVLAPTYILATPVPTPPAGALSISASLSDGPTITITPTPMPI